MKYQFRSSYELFLSDLIDPCLGNFDNSDKTSLVIVQHLNFPLEPNIPKIDSNAIDKQTLSPLL